MGRRDGESEITGLVMHAAAFTRRPAPFLQESMGDGEVGLSFVSSGGFGFEVHEGIFPLTKDCCASDF